MKKYVISAALMAATAAGATASPLTPDEALAAVLGNSPRLAPGKAHYSLAWEGNNSGVYVFNRADGGFIVAAGDSDAPAALLGYSDSATFDPSDMPPAMQAMLEQFAAGAYSASPLRASSREAIAPLVKTKWNQNAPYNLKCPTNAMIKTMTGCMATAMAQIMKYWEYPAKGSGQASVTYAGNKWSFDYDTTPFDWSNMLDEYVSGAYTTAESDAVATLMYGVGVACDMQYHDQASSATTNVSAAGMIKHLGYDKGMQLDMREFYSIEDWNQLIYDELKAGRPVLYTGVSAAGGHAFVCDGYDGTDGEYFHINWGWGGMSDGYFLVTNLDPGNQGIGGGVGAFSWQQVAMTHIKPAESGSSYYELIGEYGSFTTAKKTYNTNESVTFKTMANSGTGQAGIYNFSVVPLNITWGVKLTDNAGKETYVAGSVTRNYNTNEGSPSFHITGLNFPTSGTYTVTPAAEVDGHWIDIMQEVASRSKVTLTVDGETLNFTTTDNSIGLKIKEVTIDPYDVIINGEKTKVTIDVEAIGEPVEKELRPALLKERNNGTAIVAFMPWKKINLAEGESKTYEWDIAFDDNLNEGAYKFALLCPYADSYLYAWGPIDVYVADEFVEPEFKVTSLSINGNTVGDDAMRVDVAGTTTVKGTISCTRGHFIGDLAALVTDTDNKVVASVGDDTQHFDIVKGKKYNFEFSGSLSELTEGATYKLNIATIDGNSAKPLVKPVEIIIEKGASITTIAIDPTDNATEFYDLGGRRVTTPESGHIYIVRTHGETFKAIVR